MVSFSARGNNLRLQLVYYGPGLSGKTANLQALHAMCPEEHRGELFSVNTQEDRTLFFDLLPIKLGWVHGDTVHLRVYTVPGRAPADASRRVVLGGADGLAFVADSRESKMQENVDSLSDLYHNLNANRLNIKEIPLVLQYNKRDLVDALPVEILNRRLNFRGAPYFESVANRGIGVLDTLLALIRATLARTLAKRHPQKKDRDVEEALNHLEAQVRANLHAPPPGGRRVFTLPSGSTVVRPSRPSARTLAADPPVDARDLLEDALKATMETAVLCAEQKCAAGAPENQHPAPDRTGWDTLWTRCYLEGLVWDLGGAVVSFAPDGRVLTWNQAAERVFGYTQREMVGQDIALLVPNDRVEDLREAAQGAMQSQMVRELVTVGLRRGAEAFPASLMFAPVRGADGQVLACSALARVLTEAFPR